MYHDIIVVVLLWPRSYGKFILIYIYLCNHCLSTLQVCIRILPMGYLFDTTVHKKVCSFVSVRFHWALQNDILDVVFKMVFSN